MATTDIIYFYFRKFDLISINSLFLPHSLFKYIQTRAKQFEYVYAHLPENFHKSLINLTQILLIGNMKQH